MAAEGAEEVVLAGRVQPDAGRSILLERDGACGVAVIISFLGHLGHIVLSSGVVEHCNKYITKVNFFARKMICALFFSFFYQNLC